MNRKRTVCKSPSRSFTLIELLVVVAVIGVLASLLLPALKKTKERAEVIVCQGNLRQIGVMFISYTDISDGYLPFKSNDPVTGTQTDLNFSNRLVYWLDLKIPSNQRYVVSPKKDAGVFSCPSVWKGWKGLPVPGYEQYPWQFPDTCTYLPNFMWIGGYPYFPRDGNWPPPAAKIVHVKRAGFPLVIDAGLNRMLVNDHGYNRPYSRMDYNLGKFWYATTQYSWGADTGIHAFDFSPGFWHMKTNSAFPRGQCNALRLDGAVKNIQHADVTRWNGPTRGEPFFVDLRNEPEL